MGRWTEIEREYLHANYGKLTAKEIGAEINRTKNAVIGEARRMGLSQVGHHNQANPQWRQPYLAEYLHGRGKYQLILRGVTILQPKGKENATSLKHR